MVHSFDLPPGTVPLVHDLAIALPIIGEGAPGVNYKFRVTEASLYTWLLLRLREQWNPVDLETQKTELNHHLDTLEQLTSDPHKILKLREDARSSRSIVAVGCLSLIVETNLHKRLVDTMGAPLFSATAHLYIKKSLLCQTFEGDLNMDRICAKFYPLLFWNGKPQNIYAWKESVKNWVFGYRDGHDKEEFFQRMFDRRKEPSLFELLGQRLAIFKGVENHRKSASIESMIPRLESALYDIRSVSMLFQAIRSSLPEKQEIASCESDEKAFQILTHDGTGEEFPSKILSRIQTSSAARISQ